MIEIRNDEIGDDAGQKGWADRLANILIAAEPRLVGAKHAAA
jgi:predicted N-formylglutamate amidohydrolase